MYQTKAPYDFFPYAVGPCYASVCTELDPQTAKFRMNENHKPQLGGKWEICREGRFQVGNLPNGGPCHSFPNTHKHYLFYC